jgi:hypothetical protein
VPIITFVNKLDREGRDPFDLLDEIEQLLALDVTPASWPVGIGRDFLGTTICSPMRCCCSSAAPPTESPSRSAQRARRPAIRAVPAIRPHAYRESYLPLAYSGANCCMASPS